VTSPPVQYASDLTHIMPHAPHSRPRGVEHHSRHKHIPHLFRQAPKRGHVRGRPALPPATCRAATSSRSQTEECPRLATPEPPTNPLHSREGCCLTATSKPSRPPHRSHLRSRNAMILRSRADAPSTRLAARGRDARRQASRGSHDLPPRTRCVVARGGAGWGEGGGVGTICAA